MYSVVLMTALTAGSTAPDNWFRTRGGHSCYGCQGCYACSGCSGCYSCWGSGHGCSGYGYMNVSGNLCHGGHGGACYGGWGVGSYGAPSPGYSGCYGCYGCYGPLGHGGYSYWAPQGCHGCYGCYGGYSCYGTALPWHGHIEIGPVGGTKVEPKTEETPPPTPKVKEKVGGKDKDGASLENRTRVLVQLPEDAKLFIDGKLMTTTSAERTFQTPDLIPGQTYFYELKAEVVREGRTVSETQRVLLRPGQVATASFGTMDAAAATARRDR